MVFDVSPIYTNPDLNEARENPVVFHSFIEKSRDISEYSRVKIIGSGTILSDDYTYVKRRETTPENLKRAMFRTSSRGISAALTK